MSPEDRGFDDKRKRSQARPKISAPFNPVHLTSPPSPSEESSLQPSRSPPQPNRPSPLALSPDTSPFLRPVSPSLSSPSPSSPNNYPPSPRLSPKVARNFSRPTTPQSPRSPSLAAQNSKDSEQPPSLAGLSIESTATKAHDPRPLRKSWFKEENLDSLSPTTGSATAHRSTPIGSSLDPQRSESHRRSSSASSTNLVPPPSPSVAAQYSTHLSPLDSLKVTSRPGSSHKSHGPQAPPTPTSPSFFLSEEGANPHSTAPREAPRSSTDGREIVHELDSSAVPPQHRSGLVAGERKRSMWERVGRRGS